MFSVFKHVPGSLTLLLCMNRGCLELLSSHGRSIILPYTVEA